MKRYKLLTQDGYDLLKAGRTYDGNTTLSNFDTVYDIAQRYPRDWVAIEEDEEKQEKQEKRPIMTYVILSVMMALYLYAGLAEINWPLTPATMVGFYLLFKIKKDGTN